MKLDKILTWIKAHKIWTAVIGIALISMISGLAGGGGSSSPSASAPKTTPSTSAPATPAATVAPAPVQTTPSAPAPTTPAPVATFAALDSAGWAQIVKDPDAHKGETYVVYGEITQFDAATGTGEFRASASGVYQAPDSIGFVSYSDNTMFTGDSSVLSPFVKGDLFTAKVSVTGPYSYDTQIGGNTTVPELAVDSITKTGNAS